MALENLTSVALEDLTRQISSLTTLFQAIGGLIILYLIFNLINFFTNRKKNKELKDINKNLKEIKTLLSKKK
jgi:signal transduction histidine kinase